MNLGVVVRKEQLLQKRRLGDQDDADDEEDDDEEPAIGNKFRRTPLLRLSPVSTFRRLDKLGRFQGLRRKVVQSSLGKVEALGFGHESRIFRERERA